MGPWTVYMYYVHFKSLFWLVLFLESHFLVIWRCWNAEIFLPYQPCLLPIFLSISATAPSTMSVNAKVNFIPNCLCVAHIINNSYTYYQELSQLSVKYLQVFIFQHYYCTYHCNKVLLGKPVFHFLERESCGESNILARVR